MINFKIVWRFRPFGPPIGFHPGPTGVPTSILQIFLQIINSDSRSAPDKTRLTIWPLSVLVNFPTLTSFILDALASPFQIMSISRILFRRTSFSLISMILSFTLHRKLLCCHAMMRYNFKIL